MKIKFENGSVVESIDNPNPNRLPFNIQIIGIDLASEDSKDYSVIASKCGSCNTIIETRTYEEYQNGMVLTIFRTCPNCGTRFNAHYFCE